MILINIGSKFTNHKINEEIRCQEKKPKQTSRSRSRALKTSGIRNKKGIIREKCSDLLYSDNK